MIGNGGAPTVLIGLDGATFDIIEPLIGAGLMPSLGGLVEGGARAILRSTIHPLTPPAWTTMTTGRPPGAHGVFDFIRIDRTGPQPSYTLATSEDVKVPTIWSMASDAGLSATVLNFPVTFPAQPISGVVIPGYVPWSYLGRAIYPREVFKLLKERGVFAAREMSTDWQHERKAVQGLAENELDDWVEFHINRERRWSEILGLLMRERPADLTAVLFDGVDRIQHLCMHLIDPKTRADHTDAAAERTRALVLQYFADLDRYIGEIAALAGPEARLFVVSDHGFARAGERIFYANTFLEARGDLVWKADTPIDDQGRVALDENTEASQLIDWSATRAYALSSSSNAIHIRRSRGEGDPGVPDAEYPAYRAGLIADLLAAVDPLTGRRVVRHVFTREEAFPGPYGAAGPDLTLQLEDFSFISVLRAESPFRSRRSAYSTHHPDGVFVASGPGIAAGTRSAPLDIADVAATVLYSLGLPVPADLDGVVAEPVFSEAQRARWPVRIGPPAAGEAELVGAGTALSGEAEAQIRAQLKALGYL